MKLISTQLTRITVPFKNGLAFSFLLLSMMCSKMSSAHNVYYYNPPCFSQGQLTAITLQPMIANAASGSFFHWQYRTVGGAWTYLVNGNNTINGRVFSIANAAFADNTGKFSSATGALLTPVFSITNVGSPAFTTELDNVELRVLMTDALDPQLAPAGTLIYGGEEFTNAFEAKYIRLISKSNTDACYTNCTDNRVVTNPASPTLDSYYGGFEGQPFQTANFFTPNLTTAATNANTDMTLWAGGATIANRYRVINNPDSMSNGFSAIAPHSGRAMLLVSANNSCTNRIWYRTITVSNASQYYQGVMTFKAWFSKVDAGNNPNIVLEVKGGVAANSTTASYTSVGTATQTITAVAGNWVQISLSLTIPVHLYKKLEFSIKAANGCTTAASFAVDDICLLEPASGTLPIIMTPLKGIYNNGVSHLTWTTLQESNSNYFEILHSTDGTSFNSIAKVVAIGSSDRETVYKFDDIKAAPGYNYYRLKYVDKDGQNQVSNIVVLNVEIKGTFITGIYPNPFIDKVNVTISSEVAGEATVRMFDNTGKLIATQQATLRKGVNNISIDNLNSLAKGFYMIKVQTGEIVLTRKLVK